MIYLIQLVLCMLFFSSTKAMKLENYVEKGVHCVKSIATTSDHHEVLVDSLSVQSAIARSLCSIMQTCDSNAQSVTLGLVGCESLETHLSKHICDEKQDNYLLGIKWKECTFSASKKQKYTINTQININKHFECVKASCDKSIINQLLIESLSRCLRCEESKPLYPLVYHLLTSDILFVKNPFPHTTLLAFAKKSKFFKRNNPSYADLKYPFLVVLKDSDHMPGAFTLITAYYNINCVEFSEVVKSHGMADILDSSKQIDILEWAALFGIGDLFALEFYLTFLPQDYLVKKYNDIVGYLFSKFNKPIISEDGLVKPIRTIKSLMPYAENPDSYQNALLSFARILDSGEVTEDDIGREVLSVAEASIDTIALLFISYAYRCTPFNNDKITLSIKETHSQLGITGEQRLAILPLQTLCRLDSRISSVYHTINIAIEYLKYFQLKDYSTRNIDLFKKRLYQRLMQELDNKYPSEMKDDDIIECVATCKQFINTKHEPNIITDQATNARKQFIYTKYTDELFSYKCFGYSFAKCLELNKVIAQACIEKMLNITDLTQNIAIIKSIQSLISHVGVTLQFISQEYNSCIQAQCDVEKLKASGQTIPHYLGTWALKRDQIDSQVNKYRNEITSEELNAFKEGLKCRKEPTKPKQQSVKKTGKSVTESKNKK